MSQRFGFLAAVLATCWFGSHASADDWDTPLSMKAERARESLQGLGELINTALQEFNVPGLSVGIIVDGHVIWSKGYGYRDLEHRLPMTDATVAGIGSCTKAFTTFAIAQLVEEGLLDWDRPVIDVLPGFRMWDQYATQNLTLRDLVTHRSGIPRHDFMWYNSTHSRLELLKRLRYLEPTCNIRERYNYGNLSYLAAGLAMEQVTGKTWEEIVSEKILNPLGMQSTNFSTKDLQRHSDYAQPYLERNGALRKMPFRDFTNVAPAGGMNSNVQDMNRWMQMLLAQGMMSAHPLVSTAAILEMFAAQVTVSGYPENKDAYFNAYGLGWYAHSYRGHYYVCHDGGIDGYTSVVNLLPYEGIGIVVLSNKNLINLPRYLSLEIFDRILGLPSRNWLQEGLEQWQNSKKAEMAEREQEDFQRKKGTFPSHSLDDYQGKYEHPGYGIVDVVLKEGKLHAALNGISSALDHYHYDVFTIAEDSQDLIVSRKGMKFSFRNNVHGEIGELSVPFEPKAPEIVFQRKTDQQFSNLAYFRQFVGSYEIYNFTIDVMIRDGNLVAIVPGQPIFELAPVSEDEFNVQSMTSYMIRFEKDDKGKVVQALLILPYGAYTATKKN